MKIKEYSCATYLYGYLFWWRLPHVALFSRTDKRILFCSSQDPSIGGKWKVI